jgi:UPF0176 protein
MSTDFTDDAAVIGRCRVCDAATNRTENCTDPSCRSQFVVCERHSGTVTCDLHALAN